MLRTIKGKLQCTFQCHSLNVKNAENRQHKGIIGAVGENLSLTPEKETIRCPKCAKQWNIWDTTYFCSCGNEFHSKEIEDSIVQLLYACKICVQEIENQQKAKRQRVDLRESSLRSFLTSFFEKLGFYIGEATGTVIEAVIRFFVKK